MQELIRVALAIFIITKMIQSGTFAADQKQEEWWRYLISYPDVVYPEVIKRIGMQGMGLYRLVIDRKNGTVSDAQVLKSTGYKRLDDIYVANFRQWRFQPGTIGWATIPQGVRVTGHTWIRHYH